VVDLLPVAAGAWAEAGAALASEKRSDPSFVCPWRQTSCALWNGVGLQWMQFSSGNWVAPTGSYRSGGGGNESVEAFETNGPLGGSASGQAVTRVNVAQASKRPMWAPTLQLDGKVAAAGEEGNGWYRPSRERI
jgi:hypothetical protein